MFSTQRSLWLLGSASFILVVSLFMGFVHDYSFSLGFSCPLILLIPRILVGGLFKDILDMANCIFFHYFVICSAMEFCAISKHLFWNQTNRVCIHAFIHFCWFLYVVCVMLCYFLWYWIKHFCVNIVNIKGFGQWEFRQFSLMSSAYHQKCYW